jgi:hypothetical protein
VSSLESILQRVHFVRFCLHVYETSSDGSSSSSRPISAGRDVVVERISRPADRLSKKNAADDSNAIVHAFYLFANLRISFAQGIDWSKCNKVVD